MGDFFLFVFFQFFSVRPDGYQGCPKKTIEARVSSETLAPPPPPQNKIVRSGHVFVGTKRKEERVM
jgi:hypothetical protein